MRKAGSRRRKFAAPLVQSCRRRSCGPHPIRRNSPSKDGRLSTRYGATFPSKPAEGVRAAIWVAAADTGEGAADFVNIEPLLDRWQASSPISSRRSRLADELPALRAALTIGRPLGSAAFLTRLAALTRPRSSVRNRTARSREGWGSSKVMTSPYAGLARQLPPQGADSLSRRSATLRFRPFPASGPSCRLAGAATSASRVSAGR